MKNKKTMSNYIGDYIKIQSKEGFETVYSIREGCGDGTITLYEVFDGAELIFCDFKFKKSFSSHIAHEARENMIEINYCITGQFECEFEDEKITLLRDGEFSIYTMEKVMDMSSFNENYYKGINILVDVEKLDSTIKTFLGSDNFKLWDLHSYLKELDRCIVMRKNPKIAHIFSELYEVKEPLKHEYFKIKITELILFLLDLSIYDVENRKDYFCKIYMERIMEVKEYIEQYYSKHLTIKQLANVHGMSMTMMKKVFKTKYGSTIYHYIRQVRIQEAKKLILYTDKKIIDVANEVGYLNASKFSSAFKDVIGEPPLKYRKHYKY